MAIVLGSGQSVGNAIRWDFAVERGTDAKSSTTYRTGVEIEKSLKDGSVQTPKVNPKK